MGNWIAVTPQNREELEALVKTSAWIKIEANYAGLLSFKWRYDVTASGSLHICVDIDEKRFDQYFPNFFEVLTSNRTLKGLDFQGLDIIAETQSKLLDLCGLFPCLTRLGFRSCFVDEDIFLKFIKSNTQITELQWPKVAIDQSFANALGQDTTLINLNFASLLIEPSQFKILLATLTNNQTLRHLDFESCA
jgi:hypothetical protein